MVWREPLYLNLLLVDDVGLIFKNQSEDKQGRIVHRSGLNNENIKNENKKYLEIDLLFNSTEKNKVY